MATTGDYLLKNDSIAGVTSDYAGSEDSNTADDAIWLLTATYIIFTMQTGEQNIHK